MSREVDVEAAGNIEYFIDMIEREIRTARTDSEHLSVIVEELHDRVEELEGQVEDLESEKAELENELDEAKSELDEVLVNAS